MTKVSVVIPVYNVEDYLLECLESVLNQTLTHIEVICVDDGSSDASLSILNEYAKKDNRIKVLRQENKGSGSARNKALAMANGEYVAFMDADDFYPSQDVLEILLLRAVLNDALICGGSWCSFKDGKINVIYTGDYKRYTFSREGFVDYKDYQWDYGYQRFIYKREFLTKNSITFPDYRRFQDPPFMVQAMILAKRFYAIPKVSYCYRIGHNAVNWNKEKIWGLLNGLSDILMLSKQHNLHELHKSTVSRINNEYCIPIVNTLSVDSIELLELLLSINKKVDATLYDKEKYVLSIFEKILDGKKKVKV